MNVGVAWASKKPRKNERVGVDRAGKSGGLLYCAKLCHRDWAWASVRQVRKVKSRLSPSIFPSTNDFCGVIAGARNSASG